MKNTPRILSSRKRKFKLKIYFLTIHLTIGRVSEYIDHASTNELGLNNERLIQEDMKRNYV